MDERLVNCLQQVNFYKPATDARSISATGPHKTNPQLNYVGIGDTVAASDYGSQWQTAFMESEK